MEDCIFCKIVDGKMPCYKLAESKNFISFLDISPINNGHALVVPKQHSTNFLDMPEYLGTEFVEFSQRVAQAVIAASGADGFNIGLNNGPAAGQVVMHTHFHIITRFDGDGLSLWPGKQAPPEVLEKLAVQIKEHLQ